jgi:hypothetical protein
MGNARVRPDARGHPAYVGLLNPTTRCVPVSRSTKIIAAQGEALAAGELAIASDVMMAHPLALQLRNLQTLVEVAVDKNSTGPRNRSRR